MSKPVWSPTPDAVAATAMRRFHAAASACAGRDLAGTPDVHAWSLANPGAFWSLVWDRLGLLGEKGETILAADTMPGAQFFPDAKLNFAENLLVGDDARLAFTRRMMDVLFERAYRAAAAGEEKEYVTGNNDADGAYLYLWVKERFPEKANHIRAKLAQWGGNASGVNDGAAAMILASETALKKHGLRPRARVLGMATAGVAPRVMGIGPVPATEKLMARLRLKIADFDVIELNEAFAAQALAVTRGLGLPDDAAHVNPNGGAIALGHPLGMSGARLVQTAVHQLEKTGGKRALCTLCVGVGQGVSLALERV